MKNLILVAACLLTVTLTAQETDTSSVNSEMEQYFTQAFQELTENSNEPSTNSILIGFLVEKSGIPCLNGEVEECVYGKPEIDMWQRWYNDNKKNLNWTAIQNELQLND